MITLIRLISYTCVLCVVSNMYMYCTIILFRKFFLPTHTYSELHFYQISWKYPTYKVMYPKYSKHWLSKYCGTHNWFWVVFQKLFLLHFYSDSSCIRNSRALWYLFLNPNRVRNVHWILPESMYYKFVTFPYCITLWYMISHLHKDERPDHILSYDSSFTYVLYSKRKGKTCL